MKTSGIAAARHAVEIARANGGVLGLRRAAMERVADELGYLGKQKESADYTQLIDFVFPK
jgi:hypothetical protein